MKSKTTQKIDRLYEQLDNGTRDLEQILLPETEKNLSVENDPSKMTPIPLECIPINLPLPCPLYVKLKGQFVMFRRQGELVDQLRIMSFQSKGVELVFIHNTFWNFFMNTLEEMEIPNTDIPHHRIKHIQNLLISYGEELDKKAKQSKKEIFVKIKLHSFELAQALFDDSGMALNTLRRNSDPITYFLNHSVNTAIFASILGKSIGYDIETIKLLTFGAVVHNVGYLFIPKQILYKTSSLNDDEWKIMHTHPAKGAELLQSAGCDPSVVLIAFQHHERTDGTGYPQKLRGKDIHPFSKIVAIADVYDAIRSNRPHQPGQSTEETLRRMKRQEGLFEGGFLSNIFDKMK